MANVGNVEEQALKRRERLKAMRNKQRDPQEGGEPPDKKVAALDDGEALPKPIFRSYKPHDEKLKENMLVTARPKDVTDQVKEHLDAAKPQPVVDEVDLTSLAPRKPDWDLKRDIASKLEKLDRRTQRAIAELIRERLQASDEGLDFVVNAPPEDVDDDD